MTDAAAILEADGLRVVFFKQGDRYAHRFDVYDAVRTEWVAQCYSLEGAVDDDWPPSPPLQQLHVEERPTGPVVLLIGMAGRTHWSAAVEVGGDRHGLMFDVAARLQLPPKRLGSAYREEGEAPAEPQNGVLIRSTSQVERRPLRITPDIGSIIPGTITWKYEIWRDGERP